MFPPSSHGIVYESFIKSVQSVPSTNSDCTLILCGDFNPPNIPWDNDESDLAYISSSSYRLPESFVFFDLFQLNYMP